MNILELEWADDQICLSSHWNEGAANQKHSVMAGIALADLDNEGYKLHHGFLLLQEDAKVQLSFRNSEVQWMLFLWRGFIPMFSVVLIWTEKGKPNAVLCTDFHDYPEVFMRFFFSCLLQAHAFCHSTFLVCSMPHYSILPYLWSQLVLQCYISLS